MLGRKIYLKTKKKKTRPKEFTNFPLPNREIQILLILDKNPNITTTDLANLLGTNDGKLKEWYDNLLHSDLIQIKEKIIKGKKYTKKSRKPTQVSLTKDGQSVCEKIHELIDHPIYKLSVFKTKQPREKKPYSFM